MFSLDKLVKLLGPLTFNAEPVISLLNLSLLSIKNSSVFRRALSFVRENQPKYVVF